MDYDVVRTNIAAAFNTSVVDNTKFNEHLRMFYTEGSKNTSVASMIMRDELVKSIQALDGENDVLACNIRESVKNPNFDGGNYGIYRFNLSKDKLKFITNAGKILEILEYRFIDRASKDTLNAKKRFDSEFQRLYPKTGYIREYLLSLTNIKADMLKKYCKK